MEEKTKQLLTYLIQHHAFPSITSLMKLSYIVDLVSVQKIDSQVSDFDYIRFKYGPFDKKIYNYINKLLDEGVILEDSTPTQTGEVVTYKCKDDTKLSFDHLSTEEEVLIDAVLETLEGYGPKALVDVTYKTKPMRKIGAEQNNEIGLNERLDLRAE